MGKFTALGQELMGKKQKEEMKHLMKVRSRKAERKQMN